VSGESKNQAPFTRRVKAVLSKALPKKRKPVQPQKPVVVHPTSSGSVTHVKITHPAPAKPKPPAKKPVAKPNVRREMKAVMDLLLAHEPKVHYAQVRPMATRSIKTVAGLKKRLAAKGGVTMDCSESTTLIARLAGASDPNGCGYDGSGYTGTLLKHGKRIAKKDALVGDIVVFGSGDGHHVCVVYGAGDDPWLFSHGQERGPIKIRFSEEAKYQPRPATFLRFL
jgi:hypothetical protein